MDEYNRAASAWWRQERERERLSPEHRDAIMAKATEVARKMGFDEHSIRIGTEHKFELNGQEYKAAGTYNNLGTVALYPEQLSKEGAAGVVAHEIEHAKWHAYTDDVAKESRGYIDELKRIGENTPPKPDSEHIWERRGGFDAVMRADGTFRDPAVEASLKEKFPLYAAHQEFENARDRMAKEDGVTNYSKEWWKATKDPDNPRGTHWHATNETLAEMAYLKEVNGKVTGSRLWRKLYNTVNDHWKKNYWVKP